MSTVLPDAPPTDWTLADVQSHLDGIPLGRIRAYPSPGTATEADLLEVLDRTNRICELIDGTLVEKTMATRESMLAFDIGYFLKRYLEDHNLGTLAGEAGYLRILPGQVRAPDVSFICWERLPGSDEPKPAIYAVAPNLAVEVLSEGNTRKEMQRKLREYFEAGVELIWYIEPKTRTARAYTALDEWTEIGTDGSLSGGTVLPGFELPLAKLFARLERPKAGA